MIRRPSNDASRRVLNLFGAILQFPAAFFSQIVGWGKPIASIDNGIPTAPEAPASYAFSIWFVIFAWSVVYAVRQAMPGQREEPFFRRIGWWTAAAFLLNCLWMIVAQSIGNGVHLVVIIGGIALCSTCAFLRATPPQKLTRKWNRWLTVPMLAMLSGWVTVAFFLNATSVYRLGRHLSGQADSRTALVTLLMAGGTAAVILIRSRGNFWYGGTLLWALMAVAVNQRGPGGNQAVGAVAITLGAAVFFGAILLYNSRGDEPLK